jgi:uncharacterized damage-inducible protein DinB
MLDAPEDREATLSRFREGPDLLEQAVAGLQDSDLDASPPGGGWSIRQIVHHIADGDDIWKMCIKMAMGNEQVEFDLGWYASRSQQTWADRWAYSSRPIDPSMALLKAGRQHIVQLLECLPDAWSRGAAVRTSGGEDERVSVGFIVRMQADHLHHHLERIHALLRARTGGDCSTTA